MNVYAQPRSSSFACVPQSRRVWVLILDFVKSSFARSDVFFLSRDGSCLYPWRYINAREPLRSGEIGDSERKTYVASDPVRSLVHDPSEEEERRHGLVLLVVALDGLLQCLVYRPWQEYLHTERFRGNARRSTTESTRTQPAGSSWIPLPPVPPELMLCSSAS